MKQEWSEEAACKGTQADEKWFSKSPDIALLLRVKYCNRCPVLDECREYALENRPEYGVWAGMMPSSIRSMSKQQKEAS